MSTLFSEVFPINSSALPKLYAYRIEGPKARDIHSVGGGIGWVTKRSLDLDSLLVWSKAKRCLLSSSQFSESTCQKLVEACWGDDRDRYQDLRSINLAPDIPIDARAQADFVAWGLWHTVSREVQTHLRKRDIRTSLVHVRRKCRRTACVVHETPALQISIYSETTHRETLSAILDKHPDIILEGLAVKDRTKKRRALKGRIDEVVGPASNHKQRLLAFNPPKAMRDVIEAASSQTPVVRVVPFSNGKRGYDYVLSALDVIVQPSHYDQLHIPTKIQNKLTLAPDQRATLVREAVQPLRDRNWIDKAISTSSHPSNFGDTDRVDFVPAIRLGDGSTTKLKDGKTQVRSIGRHGVVKGVDLDSARPASIHIVQVQEPKQSEFGSRLKTTLNALDLTFKATPHRIRPSTEELRRKVDEIEAWKAEADGAILILPDHADDLYLCWKQETVRRGIPNQVIKESTIGNRWAIDNIALGLFAKMGGVPYVLANPLPYADRVVGLDIGRVMKERSTGTMSVAASTHLYGADGRLIGYRLEDANVEGETVPPNVLRRMFPAKAYGDKTVLIHRDGPFRGDEIQTLKTIASEMDSTFHLVEIRKQGAPRLYRHDGQTIQAEKGDYLRVDEHTAFLVSSPPPFDGSTARPLHIKVRSDDLTIEEAIHSVLSLSLMHHGSVRPPRLPVTLHYSDSVAEQIQKGIRPPERKGTRPYWL